MVPPLYGTGAVLMMNILTERRYNYYSTIVTFYCMSIQTQTYRVQIQVCDCSLRWHVFRNAFLHLVGSEEFTRGRDVSTLPVFFLLDTSGVILHTVSPDWLKTRRQQKTNLWCCCWDGVTALLPSVRAPGAFWRGSRASSPKGCLRVWNARLSWHHSTTWFDPSACPN